MYENSPLKKQIETEINNYITRTVDTGADPAYSQHKLVNRIALFDNQIYPTGKFDSNNNYKHWNDIISSRIDSEVKNLDFDRKDITVYSPYPEDEPLDLMTNLALSEWMKTNKEGEEINAAVEQGSGWGNVVWKKVKKSYERSDMRNFFVINQTAECLDESPVIERYQYSQSDIREKGKVWQNVKEVLDGCKQDYYSESMEVQGIETTVPYYEIFERNGEVSLKDLNETLGVESNDEDENIFVLARVIAAGTRTSGGGVNIKYIMYAAPLTGKMSDYYKEYHRGRYKGRWWREGIIELLFDLQVRANQIANQLSQGLELASKVIFRYEDVNAVQNVLSDIANGDAIKSKDFQQIVTRMDGFDQLMADYNRILQLANDICNSREVVQGENTPSGQPLGTTQLINLNANKLYGFLQEKLALPLSAVFQEWTVPEVIKDMKAQDVLRFVGTKEKMDRLANHIVEQWYRDNLLALGPHSPETAQLLKEQKMIELRSRPDLLVKNTEDLFKDYHPFVDITGEGLNLNNEIQMLFTMVQLEQDPVRRTAIIEDIARRKGYDYSGLPKSPPMQPTQPTQTPSVPVNDKQMQPFKVGQPTA